jgi:hypothetical protein
MLLCKQRAYYSCQWYIRAESAGRYALQEQQGPNYDVFGPCCIIYQARSVL